MTSMLKVRIDAIADKARSTPGYWADIARVASGVDATHLYITRGNYEAIRAKYARPGLGDIVAAGLSLLGITKARAQAVAQAVGVKDCGCSMRQALLNKLGEKLGLPPGNAPET